ncbi:MAG: hypothetical protein P1U80_13240 [Pseudomonadales bacterium]|nr:hypothetical protein [Pseudomonadales bacterium]
MRIGSNPFPAKTTLISPDLQRSPARHPQPDDTHAASANEKIHFRGRPEAAARAEFVSRSQNYSQNLDDLPAKSQNAIRSYQDNSIAHPHENGLEQLAGIDLYV